MKFKIGRLYRNSKDHNQVVAILGVNGENYLYMELDWPHEEFISPIYLFRDWELIE